MREAISERIPNRHAVEAHVEHRNAVVHLRGFAHTVAITTTGAVWAWGYGDSGQLGDCGGAKTDPVAVVFP